MMILLLHSTADGEELEQEMEDSDPNAGRFVRYQFTPQFLKLKTVGATYVLFFSSLLGYIFHVSECNSMLLFAYYLLIYISFPYVIFIGRKTWVLPFH